MRLNKAALVKLLEDADHAWFLNHHGEYNYREHLDFTAEFIMKHAPRTQNGMIKLSQRRDDSYIEKGANKVSSRNSSKAKR